MRHLIRLSASGIRRQCRLGVTSVQTVAGPFHSPMVCASSSRQMMVPMLATSMNMFMQPWPQQQRYFAAKKKNKKGKRGADADEDMNDDIVEELTSKKGGGKRHSLSEADVEAAEGAASQFHINTFEDKMNGCIKRLQKEFSQLRSVRANPAILDTVQVQVEGQKAPLQQLAQVSVRDPLMLVVTTYDPSMISAVDKAIRSAGLNLNPTVDGKLLRVPIPKMTKQIRDEVAKQATQIAEQARSHIRAVRQDALKHLKKLELSKDDTRHMEKQVQTLTDKFVQQVDQAMKAKVNDITSG